MFSSANGAASEQPIVTAEYTTDVAATDVDDADADAAIVAASIAEAVEPPPASGPSRRSVAVGVTLAFGAAAALTANFGQDIVVAARSKLQTLAKPERSQCSEWYEDCYGTGCCNVAGFTCFRTTEKEAKCLKSCTPGVDGLCDMPGEITDHILQEGRKVDPTMYCFAYAMQDVGSPPKQYYEVELLAGQYQKGIGIFACDDWGAWTDKYGELAPGVPLKTVDDVDGDFHFQKRKSSGTWINAGHFHQVWRHIKAEQVYKKHSWVVKLDADAVFVPSRLKPKIADILVPWGGMYLENCRYTNYGFFGNLAIYSQEAFQKLLDSIDDCRSTLPWKVGIEGGKYGAMGEDLFAQICMDSKGVRRGEAFDTNTDGCCQADRPEDQKDNKKWVPDCMSTNTPQYHPLMTPQEFFACYDNTIKTFGY